MKTLYYAIMYNPRSVDYFRFLITADDSDHAENIMKDYFKDFEAILIHSIEFVCFTDKELFKKV